MAQAMCSLHGQVEAEWKEGGIKKDGTSYKGFWKCSRNGKNPDGTWMKCRLELADTPSGKFEQSLDRAAAQTDGAKKDQTITRLAIAKSCIEAGWKWGFETQAEAEKWLAWVENKQALPHVAGGDEIPF